MGGAGAPDDLALGAETQAWLASSDDPDALVTGRYFHHRRRHDAAPAAYDSGARERLLAYLERISGVAID